MMMRAAGMRVIFRSLAIRILCSRFRMLVLVRMNVLTVCMRMGM